MKRYSEPMANGPEAVTPALTPSMPYISGKSPFFYLRDQESDP